MSEPFDLVLKGGQLVTPNGTEQGDIGLRDGRIAAIGQLDGPARESVDVSGLHVLPGVIDPQVHFREPGLEHKEDFACGTAGAALGGVTAVLEMPNTKPNTTGAAELADKCRRAKGRAWTHMAFFIGACVDNAERLGELERLPGAAGVKVFMGSSTGTLLVSDDTALAQVLANGSRRVTIHAEDEPRLIERRHLVEGGAPVSAHPEWRDVETAVRATRRILALARGVKRRLHVLHISTAEELDILAEYRDLATVEATPQHLTLAGPEAYERLGSRAQMNPPIRDARHREALWRAVNAGVVDCIGSDHAPHTLEEKSAPYPGSPSGLPGVQTLLPLMLDHMNQGRLSLQRLVDLTSAGPARVYGIAAKGRLALGYDGDLTVVDLAARREITDRWIVSRCGWTPFDGMRVTGWPVMTVVGGRLVMREDQLLGDPSGGVVRFLECL